MRFIVFLSVYLRLSLGHGCPSGSSYYSIQPHKNFRIIFADGYDVSLLGWPEGHDLHEEAVALLNKNNPNLVGANECPVTRARCLLEGLTAE